MVKMMLLETVVASSVVAFSGWQWLGHVRWLWQDRKRHVEAREARYRAFFEPCTHKHWVAYGNKRKRRFACTRCMLTLPTMMAIQVYQYDHHPNEEYDILM
jgi:hypothetical protein